MIDAETESELLKYLEQLSPAKQLQVLQFARSLGEPRQGASGRDLLELCGTLSPEAAEEMTRAIEEGCEQIDLDDWK